MKHLEKLSLSLTLICALTATVFAGETGTPPCAPGETGTPPCASQSVTEDSSSAGETPTGPSDTVDLVDIAEAAFWSLTLF